MQTHKNVIISLYDKVEFIKLFLKTHHLLYITKKSRLDLLYRVNLFLTPLILRFKTLTKLCQSIPNDAATKKKQK